MSKKKNPEPETRSLGFAVGVLLMALALVLFFMSPNVQAMFLFVVGAVVVALNHLVKYSNREAQKDE